MEGQVAGGQFQGVLVNKTRFEDLVQGIQDDYALNERKSASRLKYYVKHLTAHFGQLRASAITTEQINGYIKKRRGEQAANGTINRELGDCSCRVMNGGRVWSMASHQLCFRQRS